MPQRSEGDAEQQSLRPPVDLPPIRILVHPRPIRVAYKTVRRLVPRLWERSIWEAGGAEGRERRAGEEDSVDESDDDSSIDGEQQQEQHDGKEADEDAKAGDPGEAGGKDGDDDDDWVEVDGEQIPKDDQAMQEALAAALQETLALEKQYRRREREEKQRRRKRVRQGSYAKIDLAIHIGMAGPGKYYCLERRGHRDDYKLRDVDGELLGDEERREREGDRWIWAGLPREIETDLDVEDVLERWIRYTSVGFSCRPRSA